jgi:uncharacterized protein involved in outer membrane biogenesis
VSRGVRIIGIVIAVVVVAVGIALGVAMTNGPRLTAWAIEHPISSYIGRKVSIAGPVSVHWGSPVRLSFADLKIANAPWSTTPEMFSAGKVDVQFYASSLFHGAEDFPLISVDHARLRLETSKTGRA